MRKQTENVEAGLTTTNLLFLVNGLPDKPSGSVQRVKNTLSILNKLRRSGTSSNPLIISSPEDCR